MSVDLTLPSAMRLTMPLMLKSTLELAKRLKSALMATSMLALAAPTVMM